MGTQSSCNQRSDQTGNRTYTFFLQSMKAGSLEPTHSSCNQWSGDSLEPTFFLPAIREDDWSDCRDAQADISFQWLHMSEGPVSNDKANFLKENLLKVKGHFFMRKFECQLLLDLNMVFLFIWLSNHHTGQLHSSRFYQTKLSGPNCSKLTEILVNTVKKWII